MTTAIGVMIGIDMEDVAEREKNMMYGISATLSYCSYWTVRTVLQFDFA